MRGRRESERQPIFLPVCRFLLGSGSWLWRAYSTTVLENREVADEECRSALVTGCLDLLLCYLLIGWRPSLLHTAHHCQPGEMFIDFGCGLWPKFPRAGLRAFVRGWAAVLSGAHFMAPMGAACVVWVAQPGWVLQMSKPSCSKNRQNSPLVVSRHGDDAVGVYVP